MLAGAGCTPQVDLTSNLDPNYKVDLDRIFVVIDTRQVDAASEYTTDKQSGFSGAALDTVSFTRSFVPALRESFEAVNVEVAGHVVTGLELSSAEITDAIQAFGPDAVLNVKEAWFSVKKNDGFLGMGGSQEVTAIDLDAFILAEPRQDKAVWRARQGIESGYGGLKQMAQELATRLVELLVGDGLVDPQARQKQQGAAI